MNNVPKSCSLLLLAALAPTLMLLSTNLCAQPAKGGATSVVRRVPPQDEKERMNAWTVGLAGGLLEGAPLRLAAESGNARASFMLAETYDPAILSAWGTYGTRGEAAKAREHYAKAHAGGIREAKDRFGALRQ